MVATGSRRFDERLLEAFRLLFEGAPIPSIEVDGDGLGYVITNQSYRDYHCIVEFKWGTKTYEPRTMRAKRRMHARRAALASVRKLHHPRRGHATDDAATPG